MMSCASSPFLRLTGEKKYNESEEGVHLPKTCLPTDRAQGLVDMKRTSHTKERASLRRTKALQNSEFGTSSMVSNVLADQDQIQCDNWHLVGTTEWPHYKWQMKEARQFFGEQQASTTKHNMWSVSVGLVKTMLSNRMYLCLGW
jgi:hypothetical protein